MNASQDSRRTSRTDLFLNDEVRHRRHFQNNHERDGESPELESRTQNLEADISELSTPRLLMAPPRTGAGELAYRMSILGHRISTRFGPAGNRLESVFRLTLFFLKVFTLTRPCWPYVITLEVGMPLILMAAIELGWPTSTSNYDWDGTRHRVSFSTHIALLAVHFTALWIARRWNIICTPPLQESMPRFG